MQNLRIPNENGKAYFSWSDDDGTEKYAHEGDLVEVVMSGTGGPQHFNGRISEIFRDDGGGFVLKTEKFPGTVVMSVEGVLNMTVSG